MKKRRIMASFLALLISISSFFNIGFAQTDLNTNVDENLSEEKIVLELDGKEIKENENGEIIVDFEDIKDGNGKLKYIGTKSIPEEKVGMWAETGVSNPEAISLVDYFGECDTNTDGKITLKKKVWNTEISYGIVNNEFEAYIQPENIIKKVKVKIVTDDSNYLDISELEKLIIEGKECLSRYESKYYKKEYIGKLNTLISESERLLEKEDLKKEEIDAQIEKLKSVVENPEKKEFDKTELNKVLKEVENFNKENYTKDSYKKIDMALKIIKEDKFADQEDVDYAVGELKNAIDNLIDRSELGKEILESEKIKGDSFSEDSWNNFHEALKEARKVYDKETPSYCTPWDNSEECEEVTKKDLDEALAKLKNTRTLLSVGDKSVLKAAIEKIEKIQEDEFKQESLKGKQDILNSAKAIYMDSQATQEQIDQSVKNIENWLDKLEKKYVVYYETIDGQRIDLDNSNSIELDLSQGGGKFHLEGKPELKDGNEIYWVYDYDKLETAFTIMKTGELSLKGAGETTIKLKFTNDVNKNSDPSVVTINLKITEIPKIEDIKVYVEGKEVKDKIIIEGKKVVPLEIKAKFEDKDDYISVDRTKFEYYALNERNNDNPSDLDRGDKEGIIHLYSYNTAFLGQITSGKPGDTTIVIDFPRDGIKKEVSVEVKHVPVEEFYFNMPQEFEYFELGHAPGANNGIFLVPDVIGVKPENATYEGEIQFKFSDDSIARHQPLHGNYIEPRKDGTVDITAYLDTDGKHFEVTRTVKFYKKKIAVEKIQATNEEIEVKVDEIVPIGIETVPKDASNQEFDYKVSKDGIVEIIGNSIKGLKEGTILIEAKSKDTNSKNAAKVTVKVLPKGEARDIKKETKDAIEKSTHLLQKDKFEVGEEWNIFGLARNDEKLLSKEQKDEYVDSIIESMKKRNRFSVKGKPTDIERLVIVLTAIGKDVENVNGENLLRNIYQNPNISNGSNEAIFALIALDTLNYKVPDNAMWSRNELIEEVKRYQNPNGGFGLFDNKIASIDMTAMALQALSTYKDRDDVKPVIEKALDYLRENQTEYGGFIDYGKENAESAAQVLVALTSLGIDPLDPSNKFGDENYNIVTNILSYRNLEDGGFKHWKEDTKSNGMATTQSYYSLVSYLRFAEKRNKLYDMRDEKEEKQDNFGFNSYIGDPALSYVPDDWENDIWLTSTHKKGNADHIKMKIGEVDSVYPWRIPQGIVSYVNNDVERPNFNFEILQGDSVELLSNSTTDTVDIKAVKKGDTVIKVTYDEFTHSKGKYFPASSKVNTKYIVYSVGAEQNIDIKTDIETNIAKTIYFVDSKTTPYTFEVNAPGATELIVTINGKKVSDLSDNKYTVDLENRQNIIGIVAIDDKGKISTHYEMIEARLIELKIENLTRGDLDEIYDGQDVGISFKGIKLPVPKIATYYNPFMNSMWSQQGEEASYVEYVVNNEIGKVRSHGGQYDLATNNQIKIENIKAGKHTFSNGKIYEGWWGVKLGDHNKRETTNWAGGVGIAPSNEIEPRCELPEFVIEVKEKNDNIESPLVDFRLETKEVRLALGSTFQLKPIFKFAENTPEDVKEKYKNVKYSSHLFELDNPSKIREDENRYWLTVNKEGLVKINQNMPGKNSPIDENGVAIKAQTIDGKTFICTVRIKKDGEPQPKPEIAKTKLEEVINKAEKIDIQGKTEESVKALKEAILEGEKVIKKEEITQEEVDKAVKVIEAAINNLEDKEDPGEPEPKPEIDKTKLKETINKAEKIDIKDKTEESIKALNETISRGKEILEKKEATQEEVNNAVKEIEIAISNLKDKEEPEPEIDKTGLEAAISKAEKLEVEDKTVESIKDLNDAISKGKEIFESKTATQEEVNKTLELLKVAINGLKVKPTDPKEPTNTVEPKDPKDEDDDKKPGVPTKPQTPNKLETINKVNNETVKPNIQDKSTKASLPRTGQSSMIWINILGATLLAIGIWINKRRHKEI